MHKRLTPFDSLCDPANLLKAWRTVRKSKGAAGIDQVTLAEYERDLLPNLAALAQRVREGRYYPMPLRTFELKKANGGARTIAILTIEDRILQRTALEALEPLFEPAFLDCSFGFRPNRSTAMAVQRVLDYRAAGDLYVVDGDIADCFGSLDHQLLMQFVSARVRDKRMLSLLQMWLDSGQTLPPTEAAQADDNASWYDRASTFAANSLDRAVSHLLAERGVGGYGYAYAADDLYAATEPVEVKDAARKEAYKRLGKDAALLGLTYLARVGRLISPATLAITGAMVVASAAYPYAARKWRERQGPRRIGAVQGGSLSPLFSNIYLHEFDVALTRAGLHLVRFADDWVICCRDAQSAQAALDGATQKLAELRLQVQPQKTRLTRFDEGLEFLGYRFAQFENTAAPIAAKNSLPALKALATARAKVMPVAKQATQQAKDRLAQLKARLQRKGGTP
jgi:RNA-directed DNA polymerase